MYEVPETKGPTYYGVLKDGRVQHFVKKPKRPHVEEYWCTVEFQHQWHFLTTHTGKMCDYESHCGYDRGPKFERMIRKMLA